MAKKKRKLSRYNIFVKRQVLAGKSFAQAARAWRGGKTRTLKTRKRAVKRRSVTHMARRRRRTYRASPRRRSSRRGISLTRGLFPVGGLFASALIGAGVAGLQRKFLPQVIPYQGAAAGFAVGGIGGAAGAFVSEMLGNGAGIQIPGGLY